MNKAINNLTCLIIDLVSLCYWIEIAYKQIQNYQLTTKLITYIKIHGSESWGQGGSSKWHILQEQELWKSKMLDKSLLYTSTKWHFYTCTSVYHTKAALPYSFKSINAYTDSLLYMWSSKWNPALFAPSGILRNTVLKYSAMTSALYCACVLSSKILSYLLVFIIANLLYLWWLNLMVFFAIPFCCQYW